MENLIKDIYETKTVVTINPSTVINGFILLIIGFCIGYTTCLLIG